MLFEPANVILFLTHIFGSFWPHFLNLALSANNKLYTFSPFQFNYPYEGGANTCCMSALQAHRNFTPL